VEMYRNDAFTRSTKDGNQLMILDYVVVEKQDTLKALRSAFADGSQIFRSSRVESGLVIGFFSGRSESEARCLILCCCHGRTPDSITCFVTGITLSVSFVSLVTFPLLLKNFTIAPVK
jgi:hypothetical protein